MTFEKEVGEMLDPIKTEAPETSSPGTDAPSTDAPETEAPKTDAPSTDAPKTDAPSTDAPSTDAPETDAPETDAPTTEAPDEKDEEIRKLREQLEELAARVKPATIPPKTEPPGTSVPQTEPPAELIDFVGEISLDEILGDKDKFNAFMRGVASTIVEQSGVGVSEDVLRAIPDIVKLQVTQFATLSKMTEDFYKENQDLAGQKQFVGMVSQELGSKNPDWELKKLFEETAKESRKRLSLKRPPADPVKPPKKPALPGGAGGRKGKPVKKSGLAGELDAMLSVEE